MEWIRGLRLSSAKNGLVKEMTIKGKRFQKTPQPVVRVTITLGRKEIVNLASDLDKHFPGRSASTMRILVALKKLLKEKG